MDKLIQNVRNFALARFVVHERHYAFPGEDHVSERRPVPAAHRVFGWDVCHVDGSRVLIRTNVLRSRYVFCVANYDGYDFVWIFVHPLLDAAKPVYEEPGVEHLAVAVAHVESAVLGVDLDLKHAYSVVELGDGVKVLIRCDIVWLNER